MKLAALVSGGKDSCFAICESIVHGHEIVALVNLKPCTIEASQVEIDSFMFQSVATEGVRYFAEAIEVPLFQANITGTAVCQSLSYHQSPSDEVEDLFNLLASVKKQIPDMEGVTSGAILSDYQRERVEQVCKRLHLSSFAFLWRRDQRELLMDIISSKLHAVIVKIAAYGLDIKTCLGSSLSDFAPRLLRLSEDPICPLNPCGEGGEFETFTFDCPLFRHRIVPTQQPTTIMHSDDAFAPVAYLNYGGLALQTKDPKEVKTSAEELLAMETEIDVGSGSLCRRPFRSIRHRLLALASEVPQEVSQRLVSCDSAPPLTTAARLPPSQKAPPGTCPLGGCLFMTQTFTGVAALPSSGDVRRSITKATQSALNRMQRHLGKGAGSDA
uniref:Diphthine--ammonia ligase n=1 Tax=Schistocephalus solidus TaxID=70667 RepID=A0A0X3PSF6_SCHSO